MKTTTVRFWPKSEPIPKGWRVAGQRVSHHNRHSVLIERVEPEERQAPAVSTSATQARDKSA